MSIWIDYEIQREFTDWADLCDRHNAEVDELRAKISSLEYRIEHPPLAENQDDLARIAYEAYMGYTSADALADRPWAATDEWESYGWRLAANAVRVAVEAEAVELQRRLEAVVGAVKDNAESACYCEFDKYETRTMHCEYCELADQAVAIAEGRES